MPSLPNDRKKVQVPDLAAWKAEGRRMTMITAYDATFARLVDEAGVRQLIVAGGETSGAVVKALAVKALRIGAMIDPGVPWTLGLRDEPVALALKSGNFGTVDFFEKALANAP